MTRSTQQRKNYFRKIGFQKIRAPYARGDRFGTSCGKPAMR
jgi:hypothetical protein